MGGWCWCVGDRVGGGLVCRRQGRWGGWCWCVEDRVGGGVGAGV